MNFSNEGLAEFNPSAQEKILVNELIDIFDKQKGKDELAMWLAEFQFDHPDYANKILDMAIKEMSNRNLEVVKILQDLELRLDPYWQRHPGDNARCELVAKGAQEEVVLASGYIDKSVLS